MLDNPKQISSFILNNDTDPSIDENIEGEGGFVPDEIIEKYRQHNKQLINLAISKLRKDNPSITDADIKAMTKRVDMYLRLSKLKQEGSKKADTKEGTVRLIPGRRDKAKTPTKARKKTGESMTSQFFSCLKRMNEEISKGNLWILCDVWQEIYDGEEYRKRPYINLKFKQRVHTHSIDILLSRHRDRLARGKGLIVLIEELKAYNVEFKTVVQRDLGDTIIDDLELSFEAAASKMENARISERISEKLDYRRQQNKLNGGSHRLYGYEYDDDEGKRYTHPVEGPRVQWVYDARERGMSIRKIANAMNQMGWRTRDGNLWGSKTVSNMLRNPAYKGETVQYRNSYLFEHTGEGKVRKINPQREVVSYSDETTPALVSKEQWGRVNALLVDARKLSTRKLADPDNYTLLHFLRCAYCNDLLLLKRSRGTYKNKKTGKEYPRPAQYVCQNRTRVDNPCTGVTIVAHIVEKIAWEFIGHELEENLPNLKKALDHLVNEQMLAIDATAISRTIGDIDENITNLENSKRLIPDQYTKGVLQQSIDQLKKDRAEYERDLENTRPDQILEDTKRQNIENLLSYAEQARKGWRNAGVDERRSYLALLDFCGYIARDGDEGRDRWVFTLGLKKFFPVVLYEGNPGRYPKSKAGPGPIIDANGAIS